MTRFCPICSVPAYRAELYVCPICGNRCDKAELDRLAIQWWEEYRDRQMDQEAFGTAIPKTVIQ